MDRLTGPTGPHCQCGEPVSKQVARVFGVDGVVPACTECYVSDTTGKTYSRPGAAIGAYRQDRGHFIDD